MTHGTRLVCAALVCVYAVVALAGPSSAQEGTLEVADTLFAEKPREPISYFTSYNQNVSSGTWSQMLSYNHSAARVSFGADGSINSIQARRGLGSDGLDGNIAGRLNLRATNLWIWSLDGRFNTASNNDNLSSTKRRGNRVQLRTQYTANPWREVSAVGILSTEIQDEQSIGDRTIPDPSYASHAARDSSYTSGRRDGLSGSLTWRPQGWLELRATGSGTNFHSRTQTLRREFFVPISGSGAPFDSMVQSSSQAPSGDQQYETHVLYTGVSRTSMEVVLRDLNSDQEFYVLTRRDQERLSSDSKSGTFHLEHLPLPGAQFMLDAAIGRSLRDYRLQSNLNSLFTSRSMSATLSINKQKARGSVRFDVGRTRNDQQITQNGTIINRTLAGNAAKRVTRRLWLDGGGGITLFSRVYDDKISDRDDVRGFVNVGGGYAISAKCSTVVHFSTNRSHAVAIDPSASGGNNVQTTYQIDANLRLQVTPTFAILQFYQLNANYLIYDYDEPRNTLTRIRRIDTIMSDSLFSFGFLRLTHNFFFQDRGGFTSEQGDDHRTYGVAQESYQQNLSVTLGVRPLQGIAISATQSLANTRNYFPTSGQNTKRNRWNLNLSGEVDREIPGDMTLHGSIQHIGEYTEMPGFLPPADVVAYWLAGVTFTKEF